MADIDEIKKQVQNRRTMYENFLRTIEAHQIKAYTEALKAVPKDKDGNYDFSKLKDPKVREAFVNKMVNVFDEIGKEFLGAKPQTEYAKEIIRNAIGLTRDELNNYVTELQDHYSLDQHRKAMNKTLEKLRNVIHTPTLYKDINLSSPEIARYLDIKPTQLADVEKYPDKKDQVLSMLLSKLEQEEAFERVKERYFPQETNTKYKKAA
ncbi:hypothetical protein J7L02_03420 [Candidatus Woesearchaeota archaeon]|nr:hypothetical protein [Candidatus Woesearchaeota archaeon]